MVQLFFMSLHGLDHRYTQETRQSLSAESETTEAVAYGSLLESTYFLSQPNVMFRFSAVPLMYIYFSYFFVFAVKN